MTPEGGGPKAELVAARSADPGRWPRRHRVSRAGSLTIVTGCEARNDSDEDYMNQAFAASTSSSGDT